MSADNSPVDTPSPALPPLPPPKSKWDKADILLKALATPLAIGLVGLLSSLYLNNRQVEETNYRAFAELTARREEGDTKLRQEMFRTVLDSVLKQAKQQESVPDRILKLEILAYNFHESLDLGPIFQDVFRGVQPGSPEMARLKRVANQVVYKQVEALQSDVGTGVEGNVDFEAMKDNQVIQPIDQVLRLRLSKNQQPQEHLERRFHIDVIAYDQQHKELNLRLIVSQPGKTDPSMEQPEVDTRFKVGFFDFPSINNTRLSNGERCAVVLNFMEDHSARLGLVYFPANRASLKDRMYVEELLHNMLHIPRQDEN